MIYPGGRFRYFGFCSQNSITTEAGGMTRKDGLLALLVVVVWGLTLW